MRFLCVAAALFATGVSPCLSAEGPKPFDLEVYLRGERVFDTQCMPCHGRDGRGDGEWAAAVTTKPRDFSKGIFKFRTTPLGSLPTESDLIRTLRAGVSGTMMPSFSKLTDSEVRGVIAFVRGFSKRWEDPAAYAEPVPLPEPPDWLDRPAATEHRRNGAALFTQTCVPCHGSGGKGDGPAAIALRDVWGHAITPADLTNPHHKSGERPLDLYRTISMGLDGTPMVGFLAALGPDKIWDLVAFIRSLEQTPADPATSLSSPQAQ